MGETDDKDTSQRIRLHRVHALWMRWTHWLNFPLLAIMLLSGVFIYWANRVYTPFIPDSFYESLGLDHHLAYGMALHFYFMWFFALNGAVFICALVISGEWKEIWPSRRHWVEAWFVVQHDLGLRSELPPQGKFNAAQRIAYSGVIAMAGLSILSGVAIYKPIQFSLLRHAFFGYRAARVIHFLLAVGYLGFFVVHVGQVVRAGWNKFRAMIVGFEVEPIEAKTGESGDES